VSFSAGSCSGRLGLVAVESLACGTPVVATRVGGLRSIVRGTVPLALFGKEGYATLMGRLALPSLLAQALAATVGAALIDRLGADASLHLLLGLAVLNIAPAALLVAMARPK